jgi:hypothetical protein
MLIESGRQLHCQGPFPQHPSSLEVTFAVGNLSHQRDNTCLLRRISFSLRTLEGGLQYCTDAVVLAPAVELSGNLKERIETGLQYNLCNGAGI